MTKWTYISFETKNMKAPLEFLIYLGLRIYLELETFLLNDVGYKGGKRWGFDIVIS